ncbi:hypothetical protein OS493_015640 [Desmophyllum pertusum]|uniref:PKD/Chitinase domain-containing protein n=1 Tax=Desmophyllum pertusum TaxID=174260 RepID=A0A9X0CKS9_9CNID|nr:hypothetical protein OS493_015640 [Desmophyllum pertusum]
MWIVNIADVLDIFVISLWHNYSTAGHYNVSIWASNPVNSMTANKIADVQDPVRNLTIQPKYDTTCLEVNGTLRVHLSVNGTDPRYFYDFGRPIKPYNDVSSVVKNSKVTVCKPVIPLATLAVTSSPTNLTDPVEFTMTLAAGSDFKCIFNYGDGGIDVFREICYNLTYFADGVSLDKTPFMNLEFKAAHNFSDVGRYAIYVDCSNRLSAVNFTTSSIVQKPITDLELPDLPPQILGKNNPIAWTMTNGTNVTFDMKAEGTKIRYSSFKTDVGDVLITNLGHISLPGVYHVTLRAWNEVSEANRSIILTIQDDVTHVSNVTWTTTSDFGSNIPGFGAEKNIFPCEYPVNFTATPDKGTNLTYHWKFGDGIEQKYQRTHHHPQIRRRCKRVLEQT